MSRTFLPIISIQEETSETDEDSLVQIIQKVNFCQNHGDVYRHIRVPEHFSGSSILREDFFRIPTFFSRVCLATMSSIGERGGKPGVANSSGGRVVTKRTVRTVAGSGPATATPWGVSLKPVPKKVVTEVTEETKTSKKADPKVAKRTTGAGVKTIKSVQIKDPPSKVQSLELQVGRLEFQCCMDFISVVFRR